MQYFNEILSFFPDQETKIDLIFNNQSSDFLRINYFFLNQTQIIGMQRFHMESHVGDVIEISRKQNKYEVASSVSETKAIQGIETYLQLLKKHNNEIKIKALLNLPLRIKIQK